MCKNLSPTKTRRGNCLVLPHTGYALTDKFLSLTGRLPRSGKLPVLNLLTGQTSGFSPRRGDSLHRFKSNLAGPTATWVPLAVQNFASIAKGGGNAAPKYQKFPLFGKESPRLPWPISKIFTGFYTPNYPTLVFQISCDSHRRLRSYYWEKFGKLGQILRWIKKWIIPFMMGTTSSITMQSLGGRSHDARRLSVRKCGVCFLFVCLSRFESWAPCVRGVHSSNKHCVAVYCPISTQFTTFFSEGIALLEALYSSHFRR